MKGNTIKVMYSESW